MRVDWPVRKMNGSSAKMKKAEDARERGISSDEKLFAFYFVPDSLTKYSLTAKRESVQLVFVTPRMRNRRLCKIAVYFAK